jgi:hypothetical protein
LLLGGASVLGLLASAAARAVGRRADERDDRCRGGQLMALELLALAVGSLAPIAVHARYGHGMGIQKDMTMVALFLAPLAGVAGFSLAYALWRAIPCFGRILAPALLLAGAWLVFPHGIGRALETEATWADVRPALATIEQEVLPRLPPGSRLDADSWSNPLALAVAFEPRGYDVDLRAPWRRDALEYLVEERRPAVLLARLPLPTRTRLKRPDGQETYLSQHGYRLAASWPDSSLTPGRILSLYVRESASGGAVRESMGSAGPIRTSQNSQTPHTPHTVPRWLPTDGLLRPLETWRVATGALLDLTRFPAHHEPSNIARPLPPLYRPPPE